MCVIKLSESHQDTRLTAANERGAAEGARHIFLEHPRTLDRDARNLQIIHFYSVRLCVRYCALDKLLDRKRCTLRKELECGNRIGDTLPLHQLGDESDLPRG